MAAALRAAMTVLVTAKSCTGKLETINSMIGDRVHGEDKQYQDMPLKLRLHCEYAQTECSDLINIMTAYTRDVLGHDNRSAILETCVRINNAISEVKKLEGVVETLKQHLNAEEELDFGLTELKLRVGHVLVRLAGTRNAVDYLFHLHTGSTLYAQDTTQQKDAVNPDVDDKTGGEQAGGGTAGEAT